VSDAIHGGRFWAVVTLAGAVISSPLLLHLYTHGSTSPATGPQTQVIEVKFPEWLQPPKPAKPDAPGGGASLLRPNADAGPLVAEQALGSYRMFTVAELSRLTSWQLDVLRNEIYARHGRSFRRAELQAYFEQQPWYRPVYPPDAFPEGILSPIERYNANLIADYQQAH
jgi:hypothetical protein